MIYICPLSRTLLDTHLQEQANVNRRDKSEKLKISVPLYLCGESLLHFLKPCTTYQMIIHQPGSLHVGVTNS